MWHMTNADKLITPINKNIDTWKTSINDIYREMINIDKLKILINKKLRNMEHNEKQKNVAYW